MASTPLLEACRFCGYLGCESWNACMARQRGDACRLCGHADPNEIQLVARYGGSEKARVHVIECISIPACKAREAAQKAARR